MQTNTGPLTPFGVASFLGEARGSDIILRRLHLELAGRVPTFNLLPEHVTLACEMAAWVDGLSAEETEALVLMIVSSLIVTQSGSTRLPLDCPEGRAHLTSLFAQLLPKASPCQDMVARACLLIADARLQPIISRSPDGYTPFIYEAPNLYTQRLFTHEQALIAHFKRLLKGPGLAISDSGLKAAIAKALLLMGPTALTLSASQHQALKMAATQPLTIITGGPGSGKTTLAIVLLHLYDALGFTADEIAISAPTGKAANRIGELARKYLAPKGPTAGATNKPGSPNISTIHRLLGYSQRTGRFTHHSKNQLIKKIIILEEASMIDLFLMERVLDASPEGCRIVLIGDPDQLPSIDTGTVLRDLIGIADEGQPNTPLSSCTVRLEGNFRLRYSLPQANQLLQFLAALKDSGGSPEAINYLHAKGPLNTMASTTSAKALEFGGVEFLETVNGRADIKDFLDLWYERFLKPTPEILALIKASYGHETTGFTKEAEVGLTKLTSHLLRYCLLSATRVFATGTLAINQYLQQKALETQGLTAAHGFIAGELILVNNNDYHTGLMNGDLGITVKVQHGDSPPELMAVFAQDGGFTCHSLASLSGQVSHAYAMTVHKSQGSEFSCVALILPENDLPLLSKELLYTALTRSREALVVVGAKDIFYKAWQRRVARYSGLASSLNQ